MPLLTPDFKEFLQLLRDHEVAYLLIGGYAVGYHGYPRATGDMDLWIATNEATARKMAAVLKDFGFDTPETTPELFLGEHAIVRMGVPPYRIEVSNFVHGVEFQECYDRRLEVDLDGVSVSVICLEDLKRNKRAASRAKDLDDLENLP